MEEVGGEGWEGENNSLQNGTRYKLLMMCEHNADHLRRHHVQALPEAIFQYRVT